MNAKSPTRGHSVGCWSLRRRLGQGGNGEVWLAKDRNGALVAIKLLKKTRPIPYARFRDEVAALKLAAGVDGILPILDSYLPNEIGHCRPWYAMPVATPLLDAVKSMETQARVLAIAQVAETMARLHAMGIAHRDIKPGNLLIYDSRCHASDFGLVVYPNKPHLTASKEQLGPRWTMAPEVRREGRKANPFSADVYSLAKTLWIVLTEQHRGFDGQYNSDGELNIKKYCVDLYITSLEALLSDSTQHNSERRPTMEVFAKSLRDWLEISKDFRQYNRLQWRETLQKLFPHAVPTRAKWEHMDEIIAVLNVLGESSGLNHLFFPSGGGLDLERAVRCEREPGCIELITNGCINIVKPIRLQFESFDDDPQWNYFRLETGELDPTDVYPDRVGDWLYEELTEVGGEFYASRSCWDENQYSGKPLPDHSRVLMRYFRGAFVIFQKTSIYNRISATYDARHNKMGTDEFRAYIANGVAHVKGQRKEVT